MFLKPLSTAGSIYAYAPPSFCTIDGEGGDGEAGGGGGDTGGQPYDENAALARLSGLLQAEEREQDSGEGRDDGTGETPSTGEEEGQSETQDGDEPPASIEPPKSWSAEEAETFRKLPPEHQAIIARREGDRDKLILQRTEEAAETRKAAEAERAAVGNQRAEYVKNLQALAALAVPDAQQFQNVDWAKLAADNPAEYVRLSGARDAISRRLQTINQEIGRVQQQAEADHQQWKRGVITEQSKKLIERVPEFGDEQKATKLKADISTALQTHYGFTPEEIGQTIDHRLVMIAADATKWRQAEAARKSAEKKVTPATPPRVQQPGSAAQRDGNSQRVRDLQARHKKSGTIEDGALLIKAMNLA